MHQPPYVDPESGKAIMPWVRLHAIHAYYDMASILDEFPNLRMTFNFSPCLLSQMETFEDLFLDYTMKPASELDNGDRKFLLSNFFFCNHETMIRPYPRFWELYKKRGKRVMEEANISSFTQGDLLDLQVWFNLAWFGFAAEKKEQGIAELRKKERSFTEEDKAYVIEAQRRIMKEVLPLYRKLQDRGQIEISVSPFNHPILPLVYDTDLARRANPNVTLPPRFTHPEDAKAQVERAVAMGEKVFGKKPVGMWPSEGSVSPEVLMIMADAGIKWAATDEGILFRSIQGNRESLLYNPYFFNSQGRSIAMFFRDRPISDDIGYNYYKQIPEDAVLAFARRLEFISASYDKRDPCVAIVLDGENPWEYYPGAGEKFLRRLYRFLSDASVKTHTPSSYLAENQANETLTHIATGSWIEGNFNIWLGQEEDNKGWSLLKKTRDFMISYLALHPDIPPESRQKAWDHIYQAEGSDWFWWYGDQFFTEQAREFDHLFRSHLKAVYVELTEDTPQFLFIPVVSEGAVKVPTSIPTAFIKPKLDGEISNYYEWYGAGIYDPESESIARRGKGFISKILYGFDKENLYFCLDPGKAVDTSSLEGLNFHIHIIHKVEHKVSIDVPFSYDVSTFSIFKSEDGVIFQHIKDLESIAVDKVIEIAIPFSLLELREGEEMRMVVEAREGDRELERYPRHGYIVFSTPTATFDREMWAV